MAILALLRIRSGTSCNASGPGVLNRRDAHCEANAAAIDDVEHQGIGFRHYNRRSPRRIQGLIDSASCDRLQHNGCRALAVGRKNALRIRPPKVLLLLRALE